MTEPADGRTSDDHDYSHDDRTDHVEFDPRRESASVTLVRTVAAITGDEFDQLPLVADILDPDALDAFVRRGRTDTPSRADVTVQFTYHDYQVTVSSRGRITLTDSPGQTRR